MAHRIMRRTACLLSVVLGIALLPVSGFPAEAQLELNTQETRHPISKYVYGQFIEHLGRCIYGGIWAEMLQDRKFYYPITDEYDPYRTFEDRGFFQGGKFQALDSSPWKVVGGMGIVEMRDRDSFVGRHTPEISLPGGKYAGVEQLNLGLEAGKGYVGRVVVSGQESAAPIHVQLAWGDGPSQRSEMVIHELDGDYRTYPFSFTAGANTNNGRLRIVSQGEGLFRIGAVSLMPANNIEGFNAEVIQLLRELDSPVYRWPGGNFVSGYNWKDGVGERDRRPTRTNPAWTGLEYNDVGIHEFIRLCELIDSEPFIAVNTGLGGAELAAEQVAYCNASTDTAMGAWRAANGHPEPFNVKWWAVGNEMYGNWQLGHMPLEDYVEKHKNVVEAMREVDPGIQSIAVGNVGEWSRTMLEETADYMELISEHLYWRSEEDLVEHVEQPVAGIRRVVNAHRRYREEMDHLGAEDIPIALDEWNYWYGPYIYGELGVQYTLQDGLGIAAGLHEMFRNSDLYFMANYAQTVNVIGAIKTNKTDAAFETTGLVLKMYRHHFGEIPFNLDGVPEPFDMAAAWTADRSAITLAVVNPTDESHEFTLNFNGAKPAGQGELWRIAGDDRKVHNTPEQPDNVTIDYETMGSSVEKVSIQPLSVTLFKIPVENE